MAAAITTPVARSEAERAGPTRRGLSLLHPGDHPRLTFAAAGFRRVPMYSAPGTRLASYCRHRLRRPPVYPLAEPKGTPRGLLRHCRPGPQVSYRVRYPSCVSRHCSAANVSFGWSTGCKTERPLRVGPARSASLRATGGGYRGCHLLPGYARNAREQEGRPFGFPPR